MEKNLSGRRGEGGLGKDGRMDGMDGRMDGWMGAQCTQQHIVSPYCGSKLLENTQKPTAAEHESHCDRGAGGRKKNRMLHIYINTRAGAAGKVNRAEKFLWPV